MTTFLEAHYSFKEQAGLVLKAHSKTHEITANQGFMEYHRVTFGLTAALNTLQWLDKNRDALAAFIESQKAQNEGEGA